MCFKIDIVFKRYFTILFVLYDKTNRTFSASLMKNSPKVL